MHPLSLQMNIICINNMQTLCSIRNKISLHTYFAYVSKDILELLQHFTCGIAKFTFGFLSDLCDLYSGFFKSFTQKSAEEMHSYR